MATLKIVMRKNENADGTYPLVIRVTKDRKSSFIYLDKSVRESDWDAKAQRVKKTYPQSARMNHFLSTKLNEAEGKLLEMETNKTDTSAQAIRKASISAKQGTFFQQAKLYIEDLDKTGQYNRKSADEPRVNRFKEFLGNKDVTFSEIDETLLRKFRAYLLGTRHVKERTVQNHFVVIRTIFKRAIKARLADQKYYPFGKDKVVIKFPESVKIGLTQEEVIALENVELPANQNHARNLWLVSFYFAGMRASDLLRLRWPDIQDGRLYYSMGKNQKAGSLKIPAKAIKILETYREKKDHDLIFPDLTRLESFKDKNKVQIYIKTRIKSCDEYLRKIAKVLELEKPLTLHIARHTFGNISGEKISVQMLQKLYRHTHISTTIGYQANFIHKTADDALESVIG